MSEATMRDKLQWAMEQARRDYDEMYWSRDSRDYYPVEIYIDAALSALAEPTEAMIDATAPAHSGERLIAGVYWRTMVAAASEAAP